MIDMSGWASMGEAARWADAMTVGLGRAPVALTREQVRALLDEGRRGADARARVAPPPATRGTLTYPDRPGGAPLVRAWCPYCGRQEHHEQKGPAVRWAKCGRGSYALDWMRGT
jgi:hypothetical protein